MDDVKWIPSHKLKKSDYGFYKKEWSVEGSNGNSYKVKYQKGFGWWCGCLGFSFVWLNTDNLRFQQIEGYGTADYRLRGRGKSCW